jgi:hypothetical protein
MRLQKSKASKELGRTLGDICLGTSYGELYDFLCRPKGYDLKPVSERSIKYECVCIQVQGYFLVAFAFFLPSQCLRLPGILCLSIQRPSNKPSTINSLFRLNPSFLILETSYRIRSILFEESHEHASLVTLRWQLPLQGRVYDIL